MTMPRTVQRWMVLAIPIGLTIAAWLAMKAYMENKMSNDTVRPLGL